MLLARDIILLWGVAAVSYAIAVVATVKVLECNTRTRACVHTESQGPRLLFSFDIQNEVIFDCLLSCLQINYIATRVGM